MKNEQDNTSTARIMPPRKLPEPIHIRFEDLEAIREIEQAKRCERIQEYNLRGW